ncbi:MAG: peptidoglycan-binding domain-containing protein [Rhizonema sp. PD37]|nr:peptidoglycan-binding domain-containing protein [Rhizonema sp. PD37]
MPAPIVFLHIGSTGKDVEVVQRILKNLGYNVSIDGIFGFKTEAAVRRFQVTHNLMVDGIVGTVTFRTLHES